MVSHVDDDYPTTMAAGLEASTLGDGLFHAATWISTVAGLFLHWSALRRPTTPWSARSFVGLMLLGWELFDVVEGIVDHHLLSLHHVKEDSGHRLAWDLAFLAWGAIMIVVGLSLACDTQSDPLPMRETVRPPLTRINPIDSSPS